MTDADRRKVLTALVAVQVMFAIHYPTSKVLLQDLAAPAWAALRTGSAAAIFLVLYAFGRRRHLAAKDHLKLFGLAVIGVALNQIGFIEGMDRTTPAHSSLIITTVPVATLGFAVLLGREKLQWPAALGMGLALLGVLVLLQVDQLEIRAEWFLGDILTLANGASFALYLVLSRDLIRRLGPITASAGFLCWGNLITFTYGGHELAQVQWSELPVRAYILAAYGVLGPTVLAYLLNSWAVQRVEPSRVALFIYLQPILAATVSAIWLGEPVTARLIVSSIFVFLGVLLATRSRA